MNNLMLDLETLGRGPTAAIVEIGAVFFDPEAGSLGPTFQRRIHPGKSVEAGLQMDADTVLWWLRDETGARARLFADDEHVVGLYQALRDFTAYCRTETASPIKVWGNGADFDNVILRSAYDACGYPAPWDFYDNRCYRTLKNLHRDIEMQRTGTHHSALDDAISQANHALAIFKAYPATRRALEAGRDEKPA